MDNATELHDQDYQNRISDLLEIVFVMPAHEGWYGTAKVVLML